MTAPHQFPRRVLLCVTGLSPQVVTETVYYLAVRQDPPWIPTEIRLITTSKGAEHARLNLLSDEPGRFHRLRRDYDLPPIDFRPEQIQILAEADGTPLDDIRTPAHNDRAADCITDVVRELTEDTGTALHVSIAGGRKTMGYYLGYALSLYGRPQDRLSHVLVSPPYESHPEFYYPTPRQRVIHTLDAQKMALDCRVAEVTLAEIPFVSLRHGLPEHLLNGTTSFSAAVAAARAATAPPELVLDLRARRIRAGGQLIGLPPAELAMLSVFARRAVAGEPALPAPGKEVHDPEWAERYLAELQRIVGEMDDREATQRALAKGMDGDYFSQRLSKLNGRMRKVLGQAAARYLIDDGNTRPRRYRLALPPEAVRFDDLE